MNRKPAITRYRKWYATLLCLYPKPYRKRFQEPMEQTFNDLCRERTEAGQELFGFVFWMFIETSDAMIRENITFMMTQNTTKRLSVWAVVVALLLMIPLVAMQFTDQVRWELPDFMIMGSLLFGAGLAFELIAARAGNSVYKFAVGLALAAAFLLCWINGAVGIIGSDANPANRMYAGVILIAVIGALVARLRPSGMAVALFATTIAQLSVPVIAIIVWPPQTTSWGGAGVLGVFVLNAFFAAMFAASALLFRRATLERTPPLA